MATLAARDDLMAGFTAERDMGTEGAGSADTAVRNAINDGHISGPMPPAAPSAPGSAPTVPQNQSPGQGQ